MVNKKLEHRVEAEKLIELFYQEAPEIFGTGHAREFGVNMAIKLVGLIKDNHPHKIVEDEKDKLKMVSNELFWEDVERVLWEEK